jgi:hypothetical protein
LLESQKMKSRMIMGTLTKSLQEHKSTPVWRQIFG